MVTGRNALRVNPTVRASGHRPVIRLEDQPVGMHQVHRKLARSVCLQQVPPHRLARWHGCEIGRILQDAKPGAERVRHVAAIFPNQIPFRIECLGERALPDFNLHATLRHSFVT